jgi:hypothetical protein
LRLTGNIIVIIEDKKALKSLKFLKLIDKYGNIFFKYNNNIEKIIHNPKIKNPIKAISYKELLFELANWNNKPKNKLNYFIEQGLNEKTNPEANISMIIKNFTNENNTHLESYDFSYKDKRGNIQYDIPYYHENVPEGFSVFCTDEEHKLVLEYVNKKRIKEKDKTKITNIKKEDITSAPEPSKKNYICHLCRVFFNNYKKHINSENHKQMILENKNWYKNLSETFKRIVNDNKDGEKEKEEKELDILVHKGKGTYYNLRNKRNKLYKKYFDDYIILDEINTLIKSEKELPSTAYNSFRNSSMNFEENKFRKEF